MRQRLWERYVVADLLPVEGQLQRRFEWWTTLLIVLSLRKMNVYCC
jgi:hypothetical protein